MERIQFGEWVLEVDLEATQEYYRSLSVVDSSQCCRNYVQHCDNLLPEEWAFFDTLGIIPQKSTVYSYGKNRAGSFYPTLGYYYIVGQFVNKPPLHFRPEEDFNEILPVESGDLH